MNDQTINGKLLFAQNAIANGRNNAPVLGLLSEYGYDDTKLQGGKALYDTADGKQRAFLKEYGEQFAATDALHLARAEAGKEYMKDLKLARIVLKDDRELDASMQLSGRRKESYSGWLGQTKAFYANALNSPGALEGLAKVGRTQEKLESTHLKVKDVEDKRNKQLKELGEAQAATEARDHALDALGDWMSDFIGVAKIAMEGNPQYLEMLGIVTE